MKLQPCLEVLVITFSIIVWLSPPQAVHTSLTQPPAVQQEKLSSTNLYIRGLSRVCSDEDLVSLCKQ